MFIASPSPKHFHFWVPGLHREVFEVMQHTACTGPCSREAAVGEHQQALLAQPSQSRHSWEGSEQLQLALKILAGERTGARWGTGRQRPSMDFHTGYVRFDMLTLSLGTWVVLVTGTAALQQDQWGCRWGTAAADLASATWTSVHTHPTPLQQPRLAQRDAPHRAQCESSLSSNPIIKLYCKPLASHVIVSQSLQVLLTPIHLPACSC